MRFRSALGAAALAAALSGCATMMPAPVEAQTATAPAAAQAAAPADPATPSPECVAASRIPFTLGLDHLEGYRVFIGPDGDSAVEPLRIDARMLTLPFNGRDINIFNLPASPSRNVQIVVGPPNMELPLHSIAYKEMFILLSGSFTVRTKTFSAEIKPGQVLLFEDTNAPTGHGGTIGPCGYVSLSIAP